MKNSRLLLWVMLSSVCVIVCSLLAVRLFNHSFYGEQTLAATSANGEYTARVTLNGQSAIEIRDNRRGSVLPLVSRKATETLFRKGKGLRSLQWHEERVCSFFVSTGDTRADRIVWLKVSGNPSKAEVTSLEAVDD